jgi:hypothetical protein
MPEAAIDENGDLVLFDDNIGPTWQTPVMQAKPQPTSVESPADPNFRLRILPADALHHAGPGCAVDYIHL